MQYAATTLPPECTDTHDDSLTAPGWEISLLERQCGGF